MKKKKIFLIVLVTIIIFNIAIPNVVYAEDGGIGGVLLQPCLNLLASLCDGLVDILQKAITGSDGDTFWIIDRTGVHLPVILGAIAAIIVVAISVVAIAFFPPAGAATAATIAFIGKAILVTTAKAAVTFGVVTVLTGAVLPTTFYLPFIQVSPENIIGNEISLFDVNFFHPAPPIAKTVNKEVETGEFKIGRALPLSYRDQNEATFFPKVITKEDSNINMVNAKINSRLSFTDNYIKVGYEGEKIDIRKYIGKELIIGKNNELKYSTRTGTTNWKTTECFAKVEVIDKGDQYEVHFGLYAKEKVTKIEQEDVEIPTIANVMKETIAKWYYTLRTIVIIGFMLVLLYIGIRILITSVSSKKAKYKEMLVDWLVSFCLLFFMHYIMIFAIETVDLFTALIREGVIDKRAVQFYQISDKDVCDYVEERFQEEELADRKIPDGTEERAGEGYYFRPYEKTGGKVSDTATREYLVNFPVDNFMSQARMNMQTFKSDKGTVDEGKPVESTERIGWSIIYIMLTLYMGLFTWIYLKRTIYIAFLILVSPFVILTYAIDKFKDGSAQGFNAWFKEFIYNLSIQPFHLLIYTVFVGIAMDLADSSPIYVIVILGFITQGEKILRKLFGFSKAETPGVLSGAFGVGVAMSAMQRLFGRKPHHDANSKNMPQSGKDGKKPRIKEQNLDNILIGGAGGSTETTRLPLGVGKTTAKAPLGVGMQGGLGVQKGQNTNLRKATKNQRSQVNASKREKPEFNLGRAMARGSRRYVYNKAANFSKRIDKMNFTRSALGGMAALTVGTAGVMFGAMEGSPEKAAKYAGVLGGVAYKGISNGGKTPSEKNAARETYMKAGYGSDYKEYQKMQLEKEMKHNLDYRESLENMGMSREEIANFYDNALPEYIDAGMEDFEDMKACEKLQRNGVAYSRAQAIDIAAKAQRVGQDTRMNMTSKQMKEYNDTFIAANARGKQLLEARAAIEEEKAKKIKEAQDSNPNDSEALAKAIEQINEEFENNSQLKQIDEALDQIRNGLINGKDGVIDEFWNAKD